MSQIRYALIALSILAGIALGYLCVAGERSGVIP